MMNEQMIYEAVLSARSGNTQALKELLTIYDPFVSDYSKCTAYDENGNSYETVDEELKQRLQAKLAYLLLHDCDSRRLSRMLDRYA